MGDVRFTKDPVAVLDHPFNWAAWLADDESIVDYDVTAEVGINVDTVSEANGIVTAWLSGGSEGEDYVVSCTITTTYGRTDRRSITVSVRSR